MPGVDVDAINLFRRQALLNCGRVVPITQMFDADGDETDAPSEALAFTAGPIPGGGFISDATASYNFNTLTN